MLSILAPPRSGLRMRTLRGGARHYVEKTIKTHEGSDPGSDSLPPNNTPFSVRDVSSRQFRKSCRSPPVIIYDARQKMLELASRTRR